MGVSLARAGQREPAAPAPTPARSGCFVASALVVRISCRPLVHEPAPRLGRRAALPRHGAQPVARGRPRPARQLRAGGLERRHAGTGSPALRRAPKRRAAVPGPQPRPAPAAGAARRRSSAAPVARSSWPCWRPGSRSRCGPWLCESRAIPASAVLAWAAAAGPPVAAYAFHIYTEVPSALAVALGLRLLALARRSPSRAALGAALAAGVGPAVAPRQDDTGRGRPGSRRRRVACGAALAASFARHGRGHGRPVTRPTTSTSSARPRPWRSTAACPRTPRARRSAARARPSSRPFLRTACPMRPSSCWPWPASLRPRLAGRALWPLCSSGRPSSRRSCPGGCGGAGSARRPGSSCRSCRFWRSRWPCAAARALGARPRALARRPSWPGGRASRVRGGGSRPAAAPESGEHLAAAVGRAGRRGFAGRYLPSLTRPDAADWRVTAVWAAAVLRC